MSDFDLRQSPSLSSRESAKVWVISDIQQTDPKVTHDILSAAVDDMLSLDLTLDAIWCLGDALRGPDENALEQVADIFIRELARLNLPICYLLGNHDMDFRRSQETNFYPLWQKARKEKNWHVAEKLDDFFFARKIGNCLVLFMGDHADPAGAWFTTHGGVNEKSKGSYPHHPSRYSKLTEAMAEFGGPVLIASHYALPGGQKPSPLMAQLLPFPSNVKLFLHGHAHIGDLVWNKDDPWERDHAITGQSLRQYNISALESVRSPGSHSALLELDAQGPVNLRIRSHQDRSWLETYTLGQESTLDRPE